MNDLDETNLRWGGGSSIYSHAHSGCFNFLRVAARMGIGKNGQIWAKWFKKNQISYQSHIIVIRYWLNIIKAGYVSFLMIVSIKYYLYHYETILFQEWIIQYRNNMP